MRTRTRIGKGAALLAATGAAALGFAAEAGADMTGAQAGKLQREVDEVLRHAAPAHARTAD